MTGIQVLDKRVGVKVYAAPAPPLRTKQSCPKPRVRYLHRNMPHRRSSDVANSVWLKLREAISPSRPSRVDITLAQLVLHLAFTAFYVII